MKMNRVAIRKCRLIFSLLLTAFVLQGIYSCKTCEIELFVGENQSEVHNGTATHPFASIEDALNFVKEARKKHFCSATIHVLKGTCHLTKPILIGPDLSDLRIVGESPGTMIKGSFILNLHWSKYNDNIFQATVENGIDFDMLAVNDEMQTLARYPNYDESVRYWQGYAADAVSKEKIMSWKHPVGAILHAMHKSEWGDFHYRLISVDEDGNPVLDGGWQNNRNSEPNSKYRMVENVFEELDSPGEWFLDKGKGILYYWPKSGVDMQKAVFEGVVQKNLVTIRGDETSPVKNVSIEGVTFKHAGRTFMEKYEPLLRSDWCIYRGGAIYVEGAESCSVRNCEFTDLGGNAIFVSRYNRNVTIETNHIHEIGASAICFVGDPSAVRSPSFEYHQFVPFAEMDTIAGPANDNYPANCAAVDNLVYRTGRIEKQTAGVEIAMSMDIRVDHNTIYEVPRAGINIGDGCWGGHIIENNDVFLTVLETSDHGAFNSWGRDRFWHPDRKTMDKLVELHPQLPYLDAIHTTIIRNNRFRCDYGWDIDLDDGSSNYHIYNNLCLSGGLKLREGFSRIAENNILLNNGFHPHVWFAASKDVFRRNIVSTSHKDIRLTEWGDEVDYNLFPDQSSLELAQQKGIDRHSIFGNPGFVNPENDNFQVGKNSPALKIGFKNFPMNQFGARNKELKKKARKPEIPVLMEITENQELRSPVVKWMGMTLKNVETMAERSAAGLSETGGVLVLEKKERSNSFSPALQTGDVIVSIGGHKIDKCQQLIDIWSKAGDTGNRVLVIIRNQDEMKIEVTKN